MRRWTSELYGIEEFDTDFGIFSAEGRFSGQYRDIETATNNSGYTGELGQASASAGKAGRCPIDSTGDGPVVFEPRVKFVTVEATDRSAKIPTVTVPISASMKPTFSCSTANRVKITPSATVASIQVFPSISMMICLVIYPALSAHPSGCPAIPRTGSTRWKKMTVFPIFSPAPPLSLTIFFRCPCPGASTPAI